MNTYFSRVFTIAATVFVVGAVASTAVSAKPRMRVIDAGTGAVLADDGIMDGRGCAVGSVAVFNPQTGTFSTKPSVKCNFPTNFNFMRRGTLRQARATFRHVR